MVDSAQLAPSGWWPNLNTFERFGGSPLWVFRRERRAPCRNPAAL